MPVIVTEVPTPPLFGENAASVGDGTVKLVLLAPDCPLMVTLILPDVAEGGTTAINCALVAETTFAVMPLNATLSFEGEGSKFALAIVT